MFKSVNVTTTKMRGLTSREIRRANKKMKKSNRLPDIFRYEYSQLLKHEFSEFNLIKQVQK